MRTRLLIAAGGGGDDLAAVVLQRATAAENERAIFASYSWERLIVDPLPGPRNPSEFDGLAPLGCWNYRVTSETRPKPPAGSLLPQLVRELEVPLYLLDPREGAVGLGRQLQELIDLLDIDLVQLVDVGGDILARGDEPGLRSPLADSLTLAACADLPVTVKVLVAGPGLDGELSPHLALEYCASLGGRLVRHLDAHAADPYVHSLEWHPSEVTGLLLRAAQGHRGTAEIRDSQMRVELSGVSATVYEVGYTQVLAHNNLAQRMLTTATLHAAEVALREAGRASEIDYERQKAGRPRAVRQTFDIDALLLELHETELSAASRGVQYLALRRLADAANLSAIQLAQLRAELRRRAHPQYLPPVWRVAPA